MLDNEYIGLTNTVHALILQRNNQIIGLKSSGVRITVIFHVKVCHLKNLLKKVIFNCFGEKLN